jgi:hypothetical protein
MVDAAWFDNVEQDAAYGDIACTRNAGKVEGRPDSGYVWDGTMLVWQETRFI